MRFRNLQEKIENSVFVIIFPFSGNVDQSMNNINGKLDGLQALNATLEENISDLISINQTLEKTSNDVKTLESNVGKFKFNCKSYSSV